MTMGRPSEGEGYRKQLRQQAEQLLDLARNLRDPKLRERAEQLALDIAAEAEQSTDQNPN
jgi:hypothetical protein